MKKLARTKSEQFNKWTARSFQRPPHTSHPGTRRDYSLVSLHLCPDVPSFSPRAAAGAPARATSSSIPTGSPRTATALAPSKADRTGPGATSSLGLETGHAHRSSGPAHRSRDPRPQEQRPHPHQQTSHLPITSEQTPNRAQKLQSSPPYRRPNLVTPGPTQSCNYKEAERMGEAQPSVGLPSLSLRQGCEPYMYHGDAQAFSQRTPRAAYSSPRLAYSAYSLGSPGGLPGIGRSSWAGPGHRHGPVWA